MLTCVGHDSNADYVNTVSSKVTHLSLSHSLCLYAHIHIYIYILYICRKYMYIVYIWRKRENQGERGSKRLRTQYRILKY